MLYFRECKAIRKNIVYIIFLIIMVLFYITQFNADLNMNFSIAKGDVTYIGGESPLPSSKEGPEELGYTSAEIPEIVMPNATALLAMEYSTNEFIGYPNGFFKKIKLSEDELKQVDKIILELTGLSSEETLKLVDEGIEEGKMNPLPGVKVSQFADSGDYSDIIPIIVDYDTFKEKMKIVDELLGGGSSYEKSKMSWFGFEQLTQEDIAVEQESLIKDDKITNAYARLFCDYMGIELSMFAVFVPVAFLLRDRKSKMNELVYPRKVSTLKLIGTRYLSLVTMIFLPILIISLIPLIRIAIYAAENGYAIDYFAFIKYSFAWLLPTTLVAISIGFFFTILTETPIGILVQFAWGFTTMFTSIDGLTALAGENGNALVIRFNTVGSLAEVEAQMSALIINRISYCIFALLLLIISMLLYELKRKGRLNFDGDTIKNYVLNKNTA